jgi:hypothetical protein
VSLASASSAVANWNPSVAKVPIAGEIWALCLSHVMRHISWCWLGEEPGHGRGPHGAPLPRNVAWVLAVLGYRRRLLRRDRWSRPALLAHQVEDPLTVSDRRMLDDAIAIQGVSGRCVPLAPGNRSVASSAWPRSWCTAGSTGDFEPFAALAERLGRHGHPVTPAADAEFERPAHGSQKMSRLELAPQGATT